MGHGAQELRPVLSCVTYRDVGNAGNAGAIFGAANFPQSGMLHRSRNSSPPNVECPVTYTQIH
jgi:hypothetical protein